MPALHQHEKNLDLIFKAVSDATRRSMLDRLRDGPMTVTELAMPYAMSLNAVSKHVKALEKAGLLQRSISGREHSCHLNAAGFGEAVGWMEYYTTFWNERLDALEGHLLKRKRKQARP